MLNLLSPSKPLVPALKSAFRSSTQHTWRIPSIKTMQNPLKYIAAVLFAFAFYHFDRTYGIQSVLNASEIKMPTEAENSVNSIVVFVVAFSILLLVIAVKRVLHKRKVTLVGKATAENDCVSPSDKEQSQPISCKKISQEEYEYQASTHTELELRRLVNSDDY